MGSLVSLLVLGAIYTITYVVKNLGGKEDGRSFGESFPTIEVLEPEPEVAATTSQVATPTVNVETQRVRKKGTGYTPQTIAVENPENKVVNTTREKRLVKLANKSEAKRAFLYSEIFNRKY